MEIAVSIMFALCPNNGSDPCYKTGLLDLIVKLLQPSLKWNWILCFDLLANWACHGNSLHPSISFLLMKVNAVWLRQVNQERNFVKVQIPEIVRTPRMQTFHFFPPNIPGSFGKLGSFIQSGSEGVDAGGGFVVPIQLIYLPLIPQN